MAHKAKRNKRHIPHQDDEEYVYPTKKIRESKTRARRSDKNLIRDGLLAHENPEDEFTNNIGEDQEIMDDYNEMITEFNAAEEEDDIDDFDSHRLHDDIMDDYGEEDYLQAIDDVYGDNY